MGYEFTSVTFDSCMICGGNEFEVVKQHRLSMIDVENALVTFAVCKSCGHVCQNPLPSPAMIESYYTQASNYFISGDIEAEKAKPPTSTMIRMVELARRHKPERGTAYEIGCGAGQNLYQLGRDGWQLFGCEPSPSVAEQARHLTGGAIDTGFASDCLDGTDRYDLITIMHVLEHVYDPRALVDLAYNSLADDGLLIVEVPCTRQAQRMCGNWFALEHLSYFSAEILQRLLEKTGFEVQEMVLDDTAHLYPVVAVACRKAIGRLKRTYPNQYAANKAVLDEYLEKHRHLWGAIEQRFQHVNTAYLWGAGNHTANLMTETNLLQTTQIMGIIDSSPLKAGKTQRGYQIIDKDQFLSAYAGEYVIVSSEAFQEEITTQLIELGIAEEKIVRLYNRG